MDNNGVKLPDDNCLSTLSPVSRRVCGQESCPRWMTGDWTECNVTCGLGVRQRPYWCEVETKKIDGRYCSGETVPGHIETCKERLCASWFVGNWTDCSAKCGRRGERTREVYCREEGTTGNKVNEKLCSKKPRPIESIACSAEVCVDKMEETTTSENEVLKLPKNKSAKKLSDVDNSNHLPRYRWKVGPWRDCSMSCGGGQQDRVVACFDSLRNSRLPPYLESHCKKRPRDMRPCNLQRCPENKWIGGEWSECSVTCGRVRESYTVCTYF